MPELGPYGSVRGARGNSRPYRDSDRQTVKAVTVWPLAICSRRNNDAIAGLWAYGDAALGAGLRLRRSGRTYGTWRSCRAGAYHRAGGGDPAEQERTIARAIAAGVNYFD